MSAVDEIWASLAEERLDFAELLDTLTPEQWQTPSLCGSWTVAEVTTHMMVGPTVSMATFAVAMARGRGRFARANELMVASRMDRPRAMIAADFREYADDRFTPPGMDWHAPVAEFLVHRLDAGVPLGLDTDGDPRLWQAALGFLVSRAARRGFVDRGLPALTFAAPDVEWEDGSGPLVEAPAEALALAVTRRPTDRLEELDGPGADALRVWARRE